MDRASDYGSEGWEFKSLRARQLKIPSHGEGILFLGHFTMGSMAALCNLLEIRLSTAQAESLSQ